MPDAREAIAAGDRAREIATLRTEVARLRARLNPRSRHWPPAPKLADGLAFVGATAVGLAILRATGSAFLDHLHGRNFTTPTGVGSYFAWSTPIALSHGYLWSAMLVAPWTLALLRAHLRQPRPRLRRLARRPGFVVGFAALLSYAAAWPLQYLASAATGATLWFGDFDVHVYIATIPVGFAAGSAWAVLALAGRALPARDWLDRTGCALGLYWIGMAPVSMLATFGS